MATFMNATPSISPVKGMAMTLIDIIREEGRRLAESHCGYKYLMAHHGTYKDFMEGRMTIRRKDREGVPSTYDELRARGHTDQQIRKMFVRFFTRDYVTSNGVADPSPKLVEAEWQSFKDSLHTRKIKCPTRRGGKVTYANLVEEGESEEQIEMTFNARGHKCGAMKPGSYRSKMYEELQKMITSFNVADYYAGKRSSALSDYVEKHSKNRKPTTPTTFCQAVARMMTLVRLAHQESGADERNWKKAAEKIAKKIANDKRCTKYNTMKDQMGVDNFNRMKARDQAAKEKKAAEKVSQAGMTGRNAEFVHFRTETPEGKKFDVPPAKEYVTPLPRTTFTRPTHTKRLGYANNAGLATIVKRLLENKEKSGIGCISDIHIKFMPDPTQASSQLYQYAPILGQRPAQLRKTRDADTARTFRACGVLRYRDPERWTSPPEYYIQPDQSNGVPMRGGVYYSLPTKWKDYEQWTGFGVMGNPQKSTMMETLFKIVDNNITMVTFFANGARYQVGHSNYPSKTVDQIFNGIVKIPSPAEAAAAAAEIEKKRRAKASREKEKRERERRFRQASMNRMLGGEKHREIFGQFFGVGTKQEDSTTKAKVNLAIKLAQGDINQATFNAAMDALN